MLVLGHAAMRVDRVIVRLHVLVTNALICSPLHAVLDRIMREWH